MSKIVDMVDKRKAEMAAAPKTAPKGIHTVSVRMKPDQFKRLQNQAQALDMSANGLAAHLLFAALEELEESL